MCHFDPKSQKLPEKSVFAPFFVVFFLFFVVFFHKMVDNIMCQNGTKNFFGPGHPICVIVDPKSKKLPQKSVFAPFFVVLFHEIVDGTLLQNFVDKNWTRVFSMGHFYPQNPKISQKSVFAQFCPFQSFLFRCFIE